MWPHQFSYASLKKESPAYYLCKAPTHLRPTCNAPSSCTGVEPMYQATSFATERSEMCAHFRTKNIEQIIYEVSVALGGAPNHAPHSYRLRPGYLVSLPSSLLSAEAGLLGTIHFYQPRLAYCPPPLPRLSPPAAPASPRPPAELTDDTVQALAQRCPALTWIP